MTCRRTLILLEDYVDRELPADSIVEIDQHLESCDCCRAKYREAESLKETLRNLSVTFPEKEYQRQTLELILARTAGTASQPPSKGLIRSASPADSISFMRSIASFAVAASVLLSAILIGLESPQYSGAGLIDSNFAASPAQFKDALIAEDYGPFTQAEWNRLAGAMLMMGSPGPIRKSIIVTDLTARSR